MSAFKRKSDADDGSGSRKAAKVGGGGKMSFAEKMMAKMGHKAGEGLGKSGDGILSAIEVKQRPQGIGLGAVREKTEQDKAEAKRQAIKRGEEYEDSSEEERKARRRRKEERKQNGGGSGVGSGTSTPGGARRPKPKYRTANDIDKATEGLEIPNVLKSLVDMTGGSAKLITSTAGLMTPTFTSAVEETEQQKIATRARKELESYADAWQELQEREKFTEAETVQVKLEVAKQDDEIQQVQDVLEAMEALQRLDLARPRLAEDAAQAWEQATGQLEKLQDDYEAEIERFSLSEVAVATIAPLFKQEMLDWEPLERPLHLVPYFQRLSRILGIAKNGRALVKQNGQYGASSQRRSKATTPYESLIYSSWLPKVRNAITNSWDAHQPTQLLTLIEAWRPLLPDFIFESLVNQSIVPKLSQAIQIWNPRVSTKRKHSTPLPHIWLFPWLPILPSQHIDPTSSTGLLTEVKRKIRTVLDTWNLTDGVLPGLSAWSDVLGNSLQDALIRHLLPRLASHLAANLDIDPADQNMVPFEDVMKWSPFFKASTIAQLLIAEFFPKWMNILHMWLTSENVNFEEVGGWYTWWRQQLPEEINAVPSVQAKWEEGLVMMNQAMDLGDDATTDLPAPAAGPSKPLVKPNAVKVKEAETPRKEPGQPDVEATFKDVVEEWCENEGLMLIPLREAHEVTGLPLFRITASASGRGGVVVYLKGDVVWARKKGDKTAFGPMGLEQALVDRAEGK